jgi:pSer/pThr/pTyr-binding forkhead associated (FHA) protein
MILKISIGNEPVNEVELQDGSYIIGRSSKASILVNAEGVSRLHAQIRLEEGSFYVTDLDSMNGTFINFEKIPANIETIWPIYFPLQLSPFATLEIVDSSKAEMSKSLLTSSSASTSPQDDLNQTKTVNIFKLEKLNSSKKIVSGKFYPNKKKSETGNNLKKILPFIILAAGVLYYSQTNYLRKVESDQAKFEGNVSAKNRKSLSTNTLSAELINKLKEVKKNPPCSNALEIEFCRYLKLSIDHQEGVHIVDKQIYFFINLKRKLLDAEIEPSFSNITDFDLRFKVILLQIAFQQMRVAIKHNNLKSVILSNIIEDAPRNVVIINTDELSRPTNIDLMQIFAETEKNNLSYFNKLLVPLIKYHAN